MFAISKFLSTLGSQQARAWRHRREGRVAMRQAQDSSHQTTSPHSVKRRQPISAEMQKEIERLELAIRQGSVNVYG